MTPVTIGLGSNLGDRFGLIQAAVDRLGRDLVLLRASPLYETEPMYVLDQPAYLNGVLTAETGLGPLPLLQLLKRVEQEVGRKPRDQYGPREIDLDLLSFGSLCYAYVDDSSECGMKLTVPHPRTAERRFVLQPLFDVAPDLVLPGAGKVCDLLPSTNAQAASIKLIEDAVLSLHR